MPAALKESSVCSTMIEPSGATASAPVAAEPATVLTGPERVAIERVAVLLGDKVRHAVRVLDDIADAHLGGIERAARLRGLVQPGLVGGALGLLGNLPGQVGRGPRLAPACQLGIACHGPMGRQRVGLARRAAADAPTPAQRRGRPRRLSPRTLALSSSA